MDVQDTVSPVNGCAGYSAIGMDVLVLVPLLSWCVVHGVIKKWMCKLIAIYNAVLVSGCTYRSLCHW
jgi:isoprenylcysteine carboxyl methyltransferase (ICMT) family protein YpbQ